MKSAVLRRLAAALRGGTHPVALAEQALDAARRWSGLNALIHSQAHAVLAQAERAAARLRTGQAGPLTGIPYVHKDIFCTAGLPTTCASRMLRGFIPPYSAAVHERLEADAAVLLGKANMDEFAMGSSNEHSAFGPTHNPWRRGFVPGGSSGGSAALVAARVVPFATGTDTGGSVRQPAALCGITGLKPSYGRISRWGMIAYASSLDQAGVFAESAADCALVLGRLAGHDPRDATSSTAEVPDYEAALDSGVAGLRIGLPRSYFDAGLDPGTEAQVRAALAVLERAGAVLVDIELPDPRLAIAAYYVIAPAEASSNLARYDGVRYGHHAANAESLGELYARSRSEGFGREVQRRILAGTYVLSSGYYEAYYLRAQRARRLIAEGFEQAFAEVDLIAGPTTPEPAFAIGERSATPTALYLADLYTVSANLAGLPAISLPAGFVDGLPVGLQLKAPAFAEARLLAAGHALQQRSDWHLQQPDPAAFAAEAP